jgi:phospholipid N-methyltransferase
VLEVGAGTGAVTRQIGRLLGEEDRLDVCEIEPRFADLLDRNVLTLPNFAPAVAQGRVRLIRGAVQDLIGEREYDYVISGLPFTAFKLTEVEVIFSTIRECLKPGGVFSYFEYVGLRRISRTLRLGKARNRIRSVSAHLNRHIRAHQFARRTVLTNLPPAHARHLRFEEPEGFVARGLTGTSRSGASR